MSSKNKFDKVAHIVSFAYNYDFLDCRIELQSFFASLLKRLCFYVVSFFVKLYTVSAFKQSSMVNALSMETHPYKKSAWMSDCKPHHQFDQNDPHLHRQ